MTTGIHLKHLMGAAWTPFSLGSKLLAWWNADVIASLTLSGSQLVTWTDIKSGYAPTQSVAGARGLWSATSLNGKPGVVFDGVDDCLEMASVPAPLNGAVTVFSTLQQDALAADATTRAIIRWGGTAASNVRLAERTVVSGVNRARLGNGNGTTGVLSVDGATDFSGRHLYMGSSPASGGGSANQSIAVDNGAATSNAVAAAIGTTRLRIAANTQNTAAQFWSGIIRDLIVTAPLTAEETQRMNRFLLPRRML